MASKVTESGRLNFRCQPSTKKMLHFLARCHGRSMASENEMLIKKEYLGMAADIKKAYEEKLKQIEQGVVEDLMRTIKEIEELMTDAAIDDEEHGGGAGCTAQSA